MTLDHQKFYTLDLDSVPSPPAVAARLLESLDKESTQTSDIIKIVSADPGLSAKLIAFCNSPSQRRKHEVTNLKQAVMRIGSKRLKLLALSFSLIKRKGTSDTFDFDHFWMKSLAIAVSNSILSSHTKRASDEDFLLGLVMNVGQIALALTYPEQYTAELQKMIAKPGSSILQTESALFGGNRFEVSAELMRQWRFPQSMSERVQWLADIEKELQPSHQSLVFAAELARMLYEFDDEAERGEHAMKLMRQAITEFDLTMDNFDSLQQALFDQWSEYTTLLGIDAPQSCVENHCSLELDARKKLLDMSLDMESELRTVKANHNSLVHEAQHDSLTNLKNRRAYERDAALAIEHATTAHTSFGILILDIDYFKMINDTYGHPVGDLVLKSIGDCIAENCRAGDHAYRIGGEEFVIVLTNCPYRESIQVAERFRKKIEDHRIQIPGDEISVTVSIGVSWSKQPKGRKIEDFFESADNLLLEAKRTGRNRCMVEPDPQVEA